MPPGGGCNYIGPLKINIKGVHENDHVIMQFSKYCAYKIVESQKCTFNEKHVSMMFFLNSKAAASQFRSCENMFF